MAARPVRDAWILAHPTFPDKRPGLLKAILLALGQSAQSWQIHEACNELEHENNKKIVIAEASSAALVSALFLTVTSTVIFEVEGMPQNGIQEVHGMTNLYYSLIVISTMCFALSIIYSLSLIIIMESCNGKDATDITHALGVGVHWPISNFIVGILLLLVALLLKGYFDVDGWVWILGIVLITLQLMIFLCFLGTATQAQWDVLDGKISKKIPLSSSSPPSSSPHPTHEPAGQTADGGTSISARTRGEEFLVSGQNFGVAQDNDINMVQDWVRQLPEIEHEVHERVCTCFRDELVDVEVLVELQSADFVQLGVTKLGWQKMLLRRAREELASRLFPSN